MEHLAVRILLTGFVFLMKKEDYSDTFLSLLQC